MRSRPLALTGIVVALAFAIPAKADLRDDCLSGYEQAQILRRESRLRDARQKLLACSQQACPAAIKADCVPWLAEVDKSMPTIVVGARDAEGHDLPDVTLMIDGIVVAPKLDGMPLSIDPGARTIRVETPDGRSAEEKIIAREGEKLRAVTLKLPSAKPSPSPPPPPPPPPPIRVTPPPRDPEERGGKSVPLASLGLAGVGLVGFGAAVLFGVKAKNGADDLRSTCAPTCAQSDIDDVKTNLLLSDVGLAVGVVGFAAAAVIFFTTGSEARASAVVPARTGGGARGVSIRF